MASISDPHVSTQQLSMVSWEIIRARFPALDGVTYLNTAGGCAMPIEVGEAGISYYSDSVAKGDMCWGSWLEKTDEIRTKLAQTLGVQSDDVAFLGNASLAMNYAQQLIGVTGRALMVAGDFPSVTLPWVHCSAAADFLTPGQDGGITLKQIRDAITNQTTALIVGHVQYNSGFAFDLGELSSLCKERGIYLVVDATQSFGTRSIDLQRTPVDVLIFSGYKWSMAGYGIGAMYVNPTLLANKKLPFVGWRSAKVPYKMLYDEVTLSGGGRDLELGHPPFAAIFALGAAVDLTLQIGITRIEKRIRELTRYLHEKATESGITIASTRSDLNMSGITMLAIENPDAVVAKLRERGIFVSVRNGLVRVSPHFYNLEKDIDVLISNLAEIRT